MLSVWSTASATTLIVRGSPAPALRLPPGITPIKPSDWRPARVRDRLAFFTPLCSFVLPPTWREANETDVQLRAVYESRIEQMKKAPRRS